MATHNFQIFDESMTAIDTDQEYLAEGQRLNGVTPGLASPKMHNKLYRQCSVMAYAIASVLAARGFDANDGDAGALTNAIQRAFAFSVNGNVPNASGAVTTVRPIDAWPVGSVFLTLDNRNPSAILGGGTWVQIKGRYILAADTGYTVDGSTTYGAMTKNVPLVSHTHTFTTAAGGAHSHTISGTAESGGTHSHSITTNEKGSHTHTASTGSAGNHSHTRGNMNITGTFFGDNIGGAYNTGAFSFTGSNVTPGIVDNDEAPSRVIDFDASETWTGTTNTTGAHTHTVTVNSNGAHTHGGTAASNGAHTHTVSGSTSTSVTHTHTGTTASSGTSASFDVRPASIAVYMWRRTA